MCGQGSTRVCWGEYESACQTPHLPFLKRKQSRYSSLHEITRTSARSCLPPFGGLFTRAWVLLVKDRTPSRVLSASTLALEEMKHFVLKRQQFLIKVRLPAVRLGNGEVHHGRGKGQPQGCCHQRRREPNFSRTRGPEGPGEGSEGGRRRDQPGCWEQSLCHLLLLGFWSHLTGLSHSASPRGRLPCVTMLCGILLPAPDYSAFYTTAEFKEQTKVQ